MTDERREPTEPEASATEPDPAAVAAVDAAPPDADGAPPDADAPPAADATPQGADATPSAAALEAPEPDLAPTEPVGLRQTLSASLDAAVASSSQIRNASIYIGLLFLLLAGPGVLSIVATGASVGGFDWLIDLLAGVPSRSLGPADLSGAFAGLMTIALLGLLALNVDAIAIAVTIVGGRVAGRSTALRAAVGRARRTFWALLRAQLLVGVANLLVSLAVTGPLVDAFGLGSGTIVASAVAILVTAPFAYVAASIVLGGLGITDGIRRSMQLAARRWRLAVLVAFAATVVGELAAFGFGAGLDLVARVVIVLGIGVDGGLAGAVPFALIVMAVLVAIGSLTFTITALAAAPQVVAYLGLGGRVVDPDPIAMDGWPAAEPAAWVSRPMATAIGLAIALLVVDLVGRV